MSLRRPRVSGANRVRHRPLGDARRLAVHATVDRDRRSARRSVSPSSFARIRSRRGRPLKAGDPLAEVAEDFGVPARTSSDVARRLSVAAWVLRRPVSRPRGGAEAPSRCWVDATHSSRGVRRSRRVRPDVEWLEMCGSEGRPVLTKDRRLRHRPTRSSRSVVLRRAGVCSRDVGGLRAIEQAASFDRKRRGNSRRVSTIDEPIVYAVHADRIVRRSRHERARTASSSGSGTTATSSATTGCRTATTSSSSPTCCS